MRNTPLSGFAASPRSRSTAHCGQGDAALAAGRPLLGRPRLGRARLTRSAMDY